MDIEKMNIEELDSLVYKLAFIEKISSKEEFKKLWKHISTNKSILKEAITITRDKFDEKDTVKGTAISHFILSLPSTVDIEIYNELAEYSLRNKDIARTVIDGFSNGGTSFLLMVLKNYDFKLTQKEKEFAINEAMNKIGTTRTENMPSNPENPTEAVTLYFIEKIKSMNLSQAHGLGTFDIRYFILRNPNFLEKEKESLVYEFYKSDEAYTDFITEVEWNIINSTLNNETGEPLLKHEFLFVYSFDDLKSILKNIEDAKIIWEEIEFARWLNKVRTKQDDFTLTLKIEED